MKKFLSKAGKVLVACAMIFSCLSLNTKNADAALNYTGTQTIHVNGYDWGPGTDKTVITLNKAVTSVNAADFTAVDHRAYVDWSAGGAFVEGDIERTITAVYLSDAEGNPTTARKSKYITVELYVSPSEGDPFNYSLATGFNSWADPYEVEITGTAKLGGIKVNLSIENGTYANMVTSVDHLIEDTTEINGTTYDYSYYQPEDNGEEKGLMIWLHGAGEGTHDPTLVTLGNKAAVWSEEEFTSMDGDAYVLYPQCPTMWMDVGENTYCTADTVEDTIYTEDLMTLIQNFVAAHPDIDPDNIVIGGCSNGGYMTMNMIIHYPDYFAAAYPTCEAYYDAGITDEQIEAIKDMPIWFTCAATDTTVDPTANSVPTYERLIAAGAQNVKLTEFDKVVDTSGLYTDSEGNPYEYSGHWSWIYLDNNDPLYEENEGISMWDWLASYLVVTPHIDGTQTIYVNGYDWGPGTDKTVIALDEAVDAVDAADFTANDHRAYVDWSQGGAFVEGDIARTITNVYLSDAEGNPVEGPSAYVTVELYVSPSEGDPFNYSLATGFNSWADPYQVQITGAATVNGEKIALKVKDGTYDNMITNVDHLIEDTTEINGTTYDYSYYQPEETGESKGLMIWLHGAGEGTHDPTLVTLGNKAVVWSEEEFTSMDGDAYVLYPQCPTMWMDVGENTYCTADTVEDTIYTEDLMTLIQNFVAAHPDIDPDNIVIGGCSNGGYMTMNMIIHYPDYFAAAYPTCEAYYDAGITDEQIEAIKDMPIWFTCAATDTTVDPTANSVPTYERLIAAGAQNVKLTEFDKVVDTSGLYTDSEGNPYEYSGHWSWIYLDNNDPLYEENEGISMWNWLASYLVPTPAMDTQLYAEVTDAGEVISKMTIDFGEGNTVEGVDENTFTVHATASTAAIREGTSDASYGDYDIDRTITKVEVDGSVVTLYFSMAEGAKLAYLSSARNYPADLTYKVTQNAPVTVNGEEVTYKYPVDADNYIDEETAAFESVIVDDGINYEFYAPEADANTLVVWFHGNGEGDYLSSDNNVAQMLANRGTVAWATDEAQEIFGNAYVMAFQAPDTWYYAQRDGLLEKAYNEIMDVVEEYNIDPEKIVVSGCSAGGYMTTRMIIAYPELFAAAMINCPALDVATARGGETPTDEELATIKDSSTKIWLVQSEDDSVVKTVDCSQRLWNILTAEDEVTETRMEDDSYYSNYTTYETADGKYLMSIFDNDADAKLDFSEDYNQDGEQELVSYSSHWSWIYTLRNIPENAEGTHIWQWASDVANELHGTQTIYVNGYDWGPGTDKTVIALSEAVDAVDAADFTANDHRAYVDWSQGGAFVEGDIARTITNVYLSDAEGNPVEGPSAYVTVELYVSPSEGDPFNYSLATGFNSWADPYQVQITGAATVNGEKVSIAIKDGTYDNMITNIDHLIESTMEINGTTYDYSYYQPETEGNKGLIIWLHGAGEGTHDPSLITLGNKAVVFAEDDFTQLSDDAYVLYPQCPTMWMDVGNNTYCSEAAGNTEDTIYTEDLMTLIKTFVAEHPDIDPDNIVIGGCSNGGYMTMNMIIHYPEYFAAAYPTCEAYYDSAITDEQIEAIKDMPIWFTCAATDTTVNPKTCTLLTYARLMAAGAENVHLTYLKNVHDTSGLYYAADGKTPYEYSGHWSWIYVFNNECVLNDGTTIHEWLASYLTGADDECALSGTQTPVVTGDDWGCPVTATVVKFDKTIAADSISAADFSVIETKQNYTSEGVGDTVRQVIGAYASDAEGNPVDGDSQYVTVELYADPSNGAFYYALSTGRNNWSDPYGLTVDLTEGSTLTTTDGYTVTELKVPSDITLSNDTVICPELDLWDLCTYTTSDGGVLNYALYTPAEDEGTNSLVVWNHGAGERGSNAAVPLLANEAGKLAEEDFQTAMGGAYVLAIQSGDDYTVARALELIKYLLNTNADIDRDRVYVGGCSMGGGNTMNMLYADPDLFAAAFPICPANYSANVTDEQIESIAGVPIWFIHALNDPTVKPDTTSLALVPRLEAAGAEVHTSYFDDVHDTSGRFDDEDGNAYQYAGHWSWVYFFNNECYDEDGVNCWEWLAQQSKSSNVVTGSVAAVVTGDDWGCGVSKAVLTLDDTIKADSVQAEDFYVTMTKGTSTSARTILDAYVSDAESNKVEEDSQYVTVELYISPSEGSPASFSLKTWRNTWADPFALNVTINVDSSIESVDGVVYTNVDADGDIDIANEMICPQLEGWDIENDGFTASTGDVLSYASYTPAEDGHTNALIVWNHGVGETGEDVLIDLLCNKVTAFGDEEFQDVFDGAYVLVPQRRTGTQVSDVQELIEQFVEEHPDVDPNRVIVGGCSAGGGTTVNLLKNYPDYYAAAYPICAAGLFTDEDAANLADVPMWFIHAENDTTVNPSYTQQNIEKLEAAGNTQIHVSWFEDVHDTSGRFDDEDGNAYQYSGHWSWCYFDNNECYDENGVNCWEWLAQQTKLPFEDVPVSKWYYDYVSEAYKEGLMTGKTETTFDPYGTMTRGQVATVLYRMAGEPEVEYKGTFPDVPDGKYYSEAVEWAVAEGITTGYKSDGTFKPGNSVTRQELAVMLYRYAGSPEVDTSVLDSYPDAADVSSWAKEGMAYAVATGIITGDQGKLNPKGTANRAQAAKMLVVANSVINSGYEGLDPSTPVTVTGGQITGTYANEDQTVALYKGIPYAAAPVGDLRWKAPQDVESWEGVKECTEWGYSAIQTTQSAFMMWSDEFIIEDTGYSEDCLTLNVYANTDDIANKPVIVYVHGGGFTSGGSSCDVYDGTYIAENDVVYVTINYRVGVMGFMATNELTEEGNGTSGNYGVMDVIKALQWVQDNIATFSGDPSNVTLMGQSAGSGMIQSVLASPESKGLVSKALCESFQMYDYNLSDLETAEASWEAKAGGKTLEELRAMSSEEIFNLFGATGVPIVDGTVIPESFNDQIEDGSLTDVTLMTGWVDMDTFLFSVLSGSTEDEVVENATKIVGEDKVDAFKEIYLTDGADLTEAVHQFNIDYLMAEVTAHAAARTENEPKTYTYLFTHVMPGEMSEAYGAFHTADVPYFLGHLSHARDAYWTEDDQKVADNMSTYLLNFAKTGNPGSDWETGENGDYMVLDAECEMTSLSQAKQDLFAGLF